MKLIWLLKKKYHTMKVNVVLLLFKIIDNIISVHDK